MSCLPRHSACCVAADESSCSTATTPRSHWPPGDHDPLQTCVSAMVSAFVNDPWMVRRLPAMIQDTGFTNVRVHSHGFVQIHDAGYMVSIADRGTDTLKSSGRIGPDLAEALKAEARRRVQHGSFFGHIARATILADRPG